MPLDHTSTRRLAFIKYLYQTAMSQSRAPSPLCCASLLTMHDAVELFLQLASEHLNVGDKRPHFMDYWDILKEKLEPKELEQKESMRRLDKARIAMKHHGTLPSDPDIEAFRVNTADFFEGNTPLVFEVDLQDISMIEFVKPESSREKLRKAEEAISTGNTIEALNNIALGFEEMISDYETRKRERYSNSPFCFGPDLHLFSRFSMGIDRDSNILGSSLADFVDQAKESIVSMQEAMKILALGMDYRKYSRFKRLTPRLTRYLSGDIHLQQQFGEHNKPSPDEVRFCVDFVIESALALAEFDYSLAEK